MGDLFMVVMELCEGVPWYNPSSDQKKLLLDASRCLEESGLVHGDIRAPNVLMVGDGIRILDFDWAGKAGEARYPVALSEGVQWHKDAGAGKPIHVEHDQHMVSLLCG